MPSIRPPLAALLLATACGTTWDPRDLDGDGLSPAEGDCWDRADGPEGSGLTGADISPDAVDTPYDGYDANCAGDDDYDVDGDGWVTRDEYVGETTWGVPGSGNHQGAGDCWDDPAVDRQAAPGSDTLAPADLHPGNDAADDIWYDGYDVDCAGNSDFDQDADGHESDAHEQPNGTFGADCDDENHDVKPTATEICDREAVDEDCDGLVNGADDSVDRTTEQPWYADSDGDGFGDPDVVTAACDQPDGTVADNTDCDDDAIDTNPDGTEVCGGGDENCNGEVDEPEAEDAGTWYADSDGDGFGDEASGVRSCTQPSGMTDVGQDCDDDNIAIHPDATEICDDGNIDEDCNSLADDLDADVDPEGFSTFWLDNDSDGYGSPDSPSDACDVPANHVTNDGDCNDSDSSISPRSSEVCDALDVDEDCDGLADDADDSVEPAGYATFYADADEDSFGDLNVTSASCDPTTGTVADATDCDDEDPDINPSADEVCDDGDTDEDCDGLADDADGGVLSAGFSTFYADADGDGLGDSASTTDACDAPSGMVADATDCDDDASTCGADCTTDTDLDTVVDCKDACDDADGDEYGTTRAASSSCLHASGASCVGDAACTDTDCDDTDITINPSGQEVCDSADLDEDCDGLSDDDDPSVDSAGTTTYYTDSDGDGYGDATNTEDACDQPSGAVSDATDCDDDDILTHPGATEICNDGSDNDCDSTLGTRSGSAAYATCAYSDAVGSDVAHGIYAGNNNSTKLGQHVRLVGDLDGDGNSDLVFAAPLYDRDHNSANNGGIFVLATGNGLGLDLDATTSDTLNDSAGSARFLRGDKAGERTGTGVAGGDFDGDGLADLVVGTPFRDSDDGSIYLVTQAASFWTTTGTTVALKDYATKAKGQATDGEVGHSISLDGDTDGDGLVDLLVGSPATRVDGGGSAYLLTSTTYAATPANLTAGGGRMAYDAVLVGSGSEEAGTSVLLADLDGDGAADAIIGAPEATVSSASAGRAYMVAGPLSGSITLSAEATLAGPTTALGSTGGDAGRSVGTSDVNGDGITDVLVGARGASSASGAVYVMLGSSTYFSGTTTRTADATLTGSGAEQAGFSVSGTGDIDGDGVGDLVIGARAESSATGAAYLVLGPISGTVSLSSSTQASQLTGDSTGDEFGRSVHGGQDVNGDGYPDIVVGAPSTGTTDGTAYLFLGLAQ